MAISVSDLKGTSSIAADRLTINDNFNIVVKASNDLLSILDTTTGKFDNTGIGSNSVIVTEGLTVTQDGIDVTDGNISLDAGNIIINADSSFIQLGSLGKIADLLLPKVSSGNFHALDLSDGFNLAKLPKLTTVNIADIDIANLSGAEIVYDSDLNVVKVYDGTAWKTVTFV